MILRPYQAEAVDAVWKALQTDSTALVVQSTGSGKSLEIAELVRRAINARGDINCLVLFDSVVLLSQQADSLKRYLGENSVGIYCGTEGKYDLTKRVTVGTIQSLKPDKLNFNLIVVDECHMLDENSGRYIDFLKHQMDQNPKTKIVGFTATPFRHDGYIFGKSKFFKAPTFERGLKYFVNSGYLVPPIAKQPDHQIDLSKLRVLRGEYRQDDIDAQTLNRAMAKDQVIDALNRAIDRKKIIWACASISHADLIKSLLIEMGEDAISIHSKMSWDERDHDEARYMTGEARHLTFVTVVSKGWDHPPTDCIVLMRPTKSPALMIQICGRGLRTSPGKTDCLILDYGNVISTLGPLEKPVVTKKGKAKGQAPAAQKTCPQCRSYVAPRVMECPDCGFNWPKAEATKLNLTADEEAGFFIKQIKTMKVKDVRIVHHVSKAGNGNYKISYVPHGLFADPIDEYFAYGSDWGLKKFLIRALDLGLQIKENPYEQVHQEITKKPLAVDYELEGKYPKVRRLIYDNQYGSAV